LDRIYLGGPDASADRTINEAFQEAALRRAGLLPPPKAGLGSLNPLALNSSSRGVGSCPFLAQQALGQGGSQASSGYGASDPSALPIAAPAPIAAPTPVVSPAATPILRY